MKKKLIDIPKDAFRLPVNSIAKFVSIFKKPAKNIKTHRETEQEIPVEEEKRKLINREAEIEQSKREKTFLKIKREQEKQKKKLKF
ncbi:MAG: hypothetical protein QHH19_06315 [Candidatus Thermoplasmatota archaeon]|nr:hypothetical protein [Candidatus Thermoplasmatota archaeon]